MDYGYGTTTAYGAQGGAGGGGFMPGSQGEGSASTKRNYKADSLRPVTIKQLNEAHHRQPEEELFLIDGAETTQVTFVGQIRNISSQTTNITYKMDDGTGTIEVKVWVDSEALNNPDDSSNQKAKPQEQGYARVFGRLKAFNNKRHVGALVVRPISDFNEVTYHLLEATAVHLYFSKGPLEAQAAAGAIGTNGYAAQGQQQANGQGAGGGDNMPNLSTGARKVFGCLKQSPQTNEGLHATDIASRTGMEINEVYKAGDELMSLGKVYTTVDDLTWALLDL